jgi:hypothetical protein
VAGGTSEPRPASEETELDELAARPAGEGELENRDTDVFELRNSTDDAADRSSREELDQGDEDEGDNDTEGDGYAEGSAEEDGERDGEGDEDDGEDEDREAESEDDEDDDEGEDDAERD